MIAGRFIPPSPKSEFPEDFFCKPHCTKTSGEDNPRDDVLRTRSSLNSDHTPELPGLSLFTGIVNAMQKARRGLATWLTTGTTPLFVLDERRVVLVFNSGCESLTHWTAADVIGKTCQFQSDPNPEHLSSLTGALCPPQIRCPGEVTIRRTLIPRKDGTHVEKEIYFFPLGDGDETSSQHLLGVITDCLTPAELRETLSLNVSRHTAHLYARYGLDRLIATTPAMQRVAAQIETASKHPASVHIQGEHGTGREHVARLIHYSSPQKSRRFVPIRCETASHHELSQIFQRLQEASAQEIGTIYLDEVTSLPGALQPVVRSLSQTPGQRWVSSSTGGLEGLPSQVFLPELAASLTSLTIMVPPLRSRSTDLPLLAQQLLEECNSHRDLQHTDFAPGVLRLFQQYAWPGNVDELARVIQKASQTSKTQTVEVSDLPAEFGAGLQSRTIRPLLPPITLDDQLQQFERSCLLKALNEARGNKALAAEKLGIPRARLYRRLQHLGLEADPASTIEAPEQ